LTKAPSGPVLRFADFEVNIEAGELHRYGHRIKLQDKPFQILVALLERPGGVVSREELHQRLWTEDTFVDFDHNLNNAVDKLRKALNDSAEHPRFVETLPRRGYRFIAKVQEISTVLAPPISEPAPCDKGGMIATETPALPAPDVILSNRKMLIGPVAAAFLLAVTIFVFIRFFGLGKLLASSVNGKGTKVTSVLINKNPGIDPHDEGFSFWSLGHYESEVMRNSQNYGFDRWRIVSADQAYYFRPLTSEEEDLTATHDWVLRCVCAVEGGGAWAVIDLGRERRRFDIELIQDGGKYFVALTQQISPSFEFAGKVEFPGVNDASHPHTYELRYDHATQTAALWIDNRLILSGYRGHTQYVRGHGLMFGAGSYLLSRTGIGVFRSVRFEVQ
jgi:DNA-binding winged helix-turn-helix (wHTH) protein